MKMTPPCLGYTPPEGMWGNDSMEDGIYAFNQSISRALAGRDCLGYFSKATPWERTVSDFGYYSINGGIARALRKLAARA